MATVQNLLALRRHDPVLAAVWDAEHIEQVEVLWEEDLALEGRAGYYDGAGALKDVLQNHMLQVLCVLAMEPPAGPGERELRDAQGRRAARRGPPGGRRGGAMHAARPLRRRPHRRTAPCPPMPTRTASIPTAGPRPSPRSCSSSTPCAGGHPVRAARRQGARRPAQGGDLRFRPGAPTPADELRIGIDGPLDVALRLSGAAPITCRSRARPRRRLSPPTARVLLDVLEGGSTLSVRGDEAEEAWRVVEPVLPAWREDRVPLEEYPAGSDGPPGLA